MGSRITQEAATPMLMLTKKETRAPKRWEQSAHMIAEAILTDFITTCRKRLSAAAEA